MTLREASDYLYHTLSNYKERCSSEWCKKDFEAFEAIDEELKKQNKFRWHDLRKDPKDLPEYDYEVLFKTSKNLYMVGYYDDHDKDLKCWRDNVNNVARDVIAWREIQPLEE